jgi:hypothetical protein
MQVPSERKREVWDPGFQGLARWSSAHLTLVVPFRDMALMARVHIISRPDSLRNLCKKLRRTLLLLKMESKLQSDKQLDVLSTSPSHSGSTSDDEVAPEAIGGTTADLPAGYYRSPSFIGTVIVCI